MTAPPHTISPDEIHILRACIDDHTPVMSDLAALLSQDEIDRADAFLFETDRSRFVVRRGLLRTLLSGYLGTDPAEVCFAYGLFGKPELDHPRTPIRFNLSHSNGVALYAVALGREVGIDIEMIRTDFPALEVAEQSFAPAEMEEIGRLQENERHQAFFTCWTRKEAFVKALGTGVSTPLDRFVVSVHADDPLIVSTDYDPAQASRWSMANVGVPDDFAAALAVEGEGWVLNYMEWTGAPGRT